MIRAIVWKELREQGVIAAALAVLGGGLLIAAASFADPPAGPPPPATLMPPGLGGMLTLMLVVTAGMVCGGALFAAEREAGTMSFLEALPAGRWSLWICKLAAGLLLVAVQVGLLLGASAALGLADRPFLARLVVYSLLAFAWGMLGSTLARTTLGSVGIAIPAATVATFLFLLPITLVFSSRSASNPNRVGWLIYELLMFGTPLALSAWRFTALDRQRAAEAVLRVIPGASDGAKVRSRRAGWGIRALVWLSLRQIRVTGLVLSAFAVAFGLSLLLPTLKPLFVWPPLALAAGVLVGVRAFGDEQTHRSALFWGEFRLPIGRAWWVRIGVHLVLLAWLLLLLALPCIIRSQVQPGQRMAYGQTSLAVLFQSRIFDELGAQGWKYLLAPAVYGFAFGHLCGLLFRKLVVACGVAMMLGGAAVSVWGPSLVAGGLRHWQLWLPAAAVLVTGRLLMRAWVSDRANARTPLVRVALGMCVAAVATGAGLAYRAVQVPLKDDNTADVAFVAALPNYDENVGGREFRTATERFARAVAASQSQERVAAGPRPPLSRFEERLESIARFGWPKAYEGVEFSASLDRVYAAPPSNPEEKTWSEIAAFAATKPAGVYDPPHLINTPATTATAMDNARRMATVLLARGLQFQAIGNHAHVFAESLRTVLALLQTVPAPGGILSLDIGQEMATESLARGFQFHAETNQARFGAEFQTVLMLARTVRTGGGIYALETSQEIERSALMAADRWLERLSRGHAAQMRALAHSLQEADDSKPFDARPYILTDRYIVRGMMQVPGQWLPPLLRTPSDPADQNPAEAEFVAVAWAVPWEKERTRRLIGLANESLRPDAEGYLTGRPGGLILQGRARVGEDLTNREVFVLIMRRSVLLKVAVRTYQTERGTVPATQDELVKAQCLSRLPDDPFTDGRPFGYRVSAGEVLVSLVPPGPGRRVQEQVIRVTVNSGQAIIWSVGPDRVDQGGKVPPGGPRAEDLVFIVPEPPRQ